MERPEDQNPRLASLMRSAQDGDGSAYAALLTEAAALARTAIRRRLRGLTAQDGEDLVQDILLSLHKARATYDPSRPFIPWLMAIARHRIADRVQRDARRAVEEVPADVLPDAYASAEPVRHHDGPALARAMARLPDRQRRAIELVKLQEMSLKEAAAASGSTPSALKVAIHRGMGALRKALGAKA